MVSTWSPDHTSETGDGDAAERTPQTILGPNQTLWFGTSAPMVDVPGHLKVIAVVRLGGVLPDGQSHAGSGVPFYVITHFSPERYDTGNLGLIVPDDKANVGFDGQLIVMDGTYDPYPQQEGKPNDLSQHGGAVSLNWQWHQVPFGPAYNGQHLHFPDGSPDSVFALTMVVDNWDQDSVRIGVANTSGALMSVMGTPVSPE